MPIFIYQGRDRAGTLKAGSRTAHSADFLSAQLLEEGIVAISIQSTIEMESWFSQFNRYFFAPVVKVDDLSIFSRQMYTLTKAGIPIVSGMKHLAENLTNKTLIDALNGMVELLETGQDLATSMEAYPKIFPAIMINMVKVGQSSGHLPEAFLNINQYLELESSTTKTIKTALRYPIFVLLTLFVAIIFINVFVIPSFANVFASAKVELPWATRFLMATSHFMVHYWYVLILGTLAVGGFFYYYIHTPRGKRVWHEQVFKIPYVGNVLRKIVLLRFAQSFAIMMNSGVPIIEGIELVAQAANNEYAREKISSMREAISHGNTLTQAAAASKLFTPLELQMLSVSEDTGDVGPMLSQIAEFYQREVDYELKRLSDLIEPVLILILSGMVLILALAVYLPIWNMVKLTKIS